MNMYERLLAILEEIQPEADYETCTTLIDDQYLRSLSIITLIAEIEEEFDVTVPASEITPKNFNSAQAIFSMIQRLEEEI